MKNILSGESRAFEQAFSGDTESVRSGVRIVHSLLRPNPLFFSNADLLIKVEENRSFQFQLPVLLDFSFDSDTEH